MSVWKVQLISSPLLSTSAITHTHTQVKMLISKVLVCAVLLSFILIRISEPAIIDIEPEELQVLGSIVVTVMEQTFMKIAIPAKIPLRIRIISKVIEWADKVSTNVLLMGSMFGASVMYRKYDAWESSKVKEAVHMMKEPPRSIEMQPIENCAIDYGCDDGHCWKTCDEESTWCYTTAKPLVRKVQTCSQTADCSACWSCASRCVKTA